MINNLISPSPCFSSQVTSIGSHCIGVELLNLIPLTVEVSASQATRRSIAGVVKSGIVMDGCAYSVYFYLVIDILIVVTQVEVEVKVLLY
jgi:hypothetical protein